VQTIPQLRRLLSLISKAQHHPVLVIQEHAIVEIPELALHGLVQRFREISGQRMRGVCGADNQGQWP
jgi:hypothetical protein